MAATLFDDSESALGEASTYSSVASGALAGSAAGPGGAAAGAAIGLFTAVVSARQRRKAEQRQAEAKEQARMVAQQNRNKLVEENFAKRSRSAGQGISKGANLAPGQEGASQQGTSLLSGQGSTQPSLFG